MQHVAITLTRLDTKRAILSLHYRAVLVERRANNLPAGEAREALYREAEECRRVARLLRADLNATKTQAA